MSSHSRFSIQKRKRRQERYERLSEMQKSLSSQERKRKNTTPHITETVLRESPERTNNLDMQGVSQSFRNDDTCKREARRPILLGNSVSISGNKPCPCCGMVWKPDLCSLCGKPIERGYFRFNDRTFHITCVIQKGDWT